MNHLNEKPKYLSAKTAPGQPGVSPTWAPSDKDFATTALGPHSMLWATVGHGVLSEVYYPTTGRRQLRDMKFFIVHDDGFVDVEKVRAYEVSTPSPYVPLPTIVHKDAASGRAYKLTLTFLPDPLRAALLVSYNLEGAGRLAIVAAPHLGDSGTDNTASVSDGLLYGEAKEDALCIAADGGGFDFLSAGYEGWTDGGLDLAQDSSLDWQFEEAKNGNVTLTGRLKDCNGVLALGFAPSKVMARGQALASLADGFEKARDRFVSDWESWGQSLRGLPAPTPEIGKAAQLSATLIKVHEDRRFPGSIAASLSTPWGFARNSSGGYHLVWPRDASFTAFALIAAGLVEDARNVLAHLIATQQPSGCWAQTAFPDGRPFMTSEQLDEVATPILLAAKLKEVGAPEVLRTADMVRNAASFIVRRGPSTKQDRWEETSGLSPFTIALEIAALVAASDWLEGDERTALLDIADERNERVEEWCATPDPKAGSGAKPRYVRIAPAAEKGGLNGRVPLANRGDAFSIPAAEMVGLDFSYLVRLGLKRPDDPVVVQSMKAVDEVLKVDFPYGSLYRRYQGDGYGEHADGAPYDNQGIGRAWPLLAGERGHLAICAGEDATPWINAMLGARGPGGLIPEQVWDTDDMPERGLYRGKPAGSAMPLIWAHAEFLKLIIASQGGTPVERLAAVTQRYGAAPPQSRAWRWREDLEMAPMPPGRDLFIETRTPFSLRLGFDGAATQTEMTAEKALFGLYSVRLPAETLSGHFNVSFRRRLDDVWERRDWFVRLAVNEPKAAQP